MDELPEPPPSAADVVAGAGGLQRERRRDSSAAGRSTSRRRRSTSMTTGSPSWRAAMGPPTAASGATWPIMSPLVAPEKRPSVSRATDPPSPWPTSAAVTPSISRMPGPPFGPS